MCLIAFALNAHPHWPLVLLGNRDEFHVRPTQAAAPWEPTSLRAFGGRDLQAGGSWLMLRAQGSRLRLAALTNIRPGLRRAATFGNSSALPSSASDQSASRGMLVLRALRLEPRGTQAPGGLRLGSLDDDLRPLAEEAAAYEGFNLLVVEWNPDDPGRAQARYLNNLEPGPALLQTPTDGLHGLSNAVLDSSWPKSLRLAERLGAVLPELPRSSASTPPGHSRLRSAPQSPLQPAPSPASPPPHLSGNDPWASLLQALQDRRRAPAQALQDTGLGAQREAQLSACFIVDPVYGTRSSTVCAFDDQGQAHFAEHRFDSQGGLIGATGSEHGTVVVLHPPEQPGGNPAETPLPVAAVQALR